MYDKEKARQLWLEKDKENVEELKERQRELARNWKKKNQSKVIKVRKEYYKKILEERGHSWSEVDKYSAWLKLRNAIRKGAIKRGSCCICGKENAEGHHEDYSKPLFIVWLCRQHHIEYHSYNKFSVKEYAIDYSKTRPFLKIVQ